MTQFYAIENKEGIEEIFTKDCVITLYPTILLTVQKLPVPKGSLPLSVSFEWSYKL